MDRRVVIRLPNWVGDALMSLPAIRRLAAAGLEPTLVGRPWAADLFAGHGLPVLTPERGFSAHRKAYRDWRRESGGRTAILMPNSLASAAEARFAGLSPIGLATDGRRLLLRAAIPVPAPCHEVRRFDAVARGALKALGRTDPSPAETAADLGLVLAEDARRAADALLAAEGLSPGGYVVLAPTATGLHKGRPKLWPGFAALAAALRESGVTVIAIPTAAERDATAAALPGVRLLPPQPLSVFAALLARGGLVVANDSGASHVAAAVAAPLITVHGVTDPARTGPWSRSAESLGGAEAWPSCEAVLARAEARLALRPATPLAETPALRNKGPDRE